MKEDRLSKLSQRFKTHAVGRPRTSDRNRERRSFYLDAELVEHLDKTYRDLNYELYRAGGVTKSAFLETLIEYGLNHLPDIKAALSQGRDTDTTSGKS
jgi:hypothetical protein